MSRIISFIVLVAVVVVIGVLSYKVMASFLLPMFLAVLLVVMFKPMHRWFVKKCKGRNRLAAGLTTLVILLIVLLPMLLVISQAAGEALLMVVSLEQKLAALPQQLQPLPPEVEENFQHIQGLFHELEGRAAADELPPESPPAEQQPPDELPAKVAPPSERSPIDRRRLLDDIVLRSDQLHQSLEVLSPKTDAAAGETGTAAGETKQDDKAAMIGSWNRWQKALEELQAAEPNQEDLSQEVAAAKYALTEFRTELLGGPLWAWIKRQILLDDAQRGKLLAEVQATAGPLALGTTRLALGTTQYVGAVLIELLIGLAVMVVSLYYFLAEGPAMLKTLMRLSPLEDRYEEQLLLQFGTISRAVVLATLLSAFAQGLLGGVGYFFVGFQSVFLLIVITMLLAMVPFVGAAAVWGSCCLWLFFVDGEPTKAIGLAVYGMLIVSMADNVIKPLVLHGQSNLHPLLALLSVLGGAKAMGPIGIFVGPMVVSFLQALLVMLRSEMESLDTKPSARSTAPE